MINHENMTEDILILVKTYPSPSKKYVEISCTAGITSSGLPVRIYPIPYRFLGKDSRYRKWQWVKATLSRNTKDLRKEIHKADYTSLVLGDVIPTSKWGERTKWLGKFPTFKTVEDLEQARNEHGITLGIIKPDSLDDLEFCKEPDWTKEQLEILSRDMEVDLFAENLSTNVGTILKKVPYGFYYHFTGNGISQRVKITDWEIYALYFNTIKSTDWKEKIKAKYIKEFSQKDVYLILGNMHRFQNQWLIIGVIAAPKEIQSSLELGF